MRPVSSSRAMNAMSCWWLRWLSQSISSALSSAMRAKKRSRRSSALTSAKKSRYNAVSSGRTGRISTRSPPRVVSCPSFKPKSPLSGIGATGAPAPLSGWPLCWNVDSRAGPHTGPAPIRLSGSRFRLFRLPDADVPRFRHQPEAKDETYQRNEDRIEQRVKEAAGRCERRRGDERHQPAAPAVADVIWHRYRGVTDARREVFRQKRADRPIDHPHVVHQDGNDKDRDRIVDIVRLRHRPEPRVERIIGDGGEQKAAQDHRLATDVIGHPAPQDQGWRRDEQCGHHDVA